MPILAGQIVTAGQLNRLRPVTYFAQESSTLTRTVTTAADIPGATVTFNTEAANAVYRVDATFDSAVGTSSATTDMIGTIVIDGATAPVSGRHQMDNLDRDSVYAMATGTLAAAGSHTIKLQGALSAAAGSGTWQAFTSLIVTIYEVP